MLAAEAVQAGAAARDDHIHVAIQRQELGHARAVRVVDEQHRVLRQSGGFQCAVHARRQRPVRVQRLAPAAQDHGVAGFHGQARHVDRHVGARFVDYPQHADWDALLPEFQPTRAHGLVEPLADRIRQLGHPAQVGGDRGQARGIEPHAVNQRLAQPGGMGGGNVLGVGGKDRIPILGEHICQSEQRLVLLSGRRPRERFGRGARALAEVGYHHGHENLRCRHKF